jgi:hypothetical protein
MTGMREHQMIATVIYLATAVMDGQTIPFELNVMMCSENNVLRH